ncbi:MAG TPA: hypothetical protein VN729_08105 [Ktedonobacteraceae bacterium]|nr:hypothetical protein [Ktedonobacteraceae bacterium]
MRFVQTVFVAICRFIIAGIFWFSLRLSNSLTFHGAEQDTGEPRTYLAMTHKRDIDPLILVPALLFRRGWRGLAGDVRFALRGDGFTRGFLARILRRPNRLAWLLRSLSIGSILRWLGAYPTEGLLRPAEEWIREIMRVDGNVQAETILSPAFIQTFACQTRLSVEAVRAWPLERLLRWSNYTALQKLYGPEMLLSTKRRHIEKRVVARIHAQLDEIVASFWQGAALLGSPEGKLSPDGRISPLHAGFQRIVRAAPPDLQIVPIALSYDFMTSKRRHVFVDFGPVLEYAPKFSQAELAVRVRRSWLLHAHFTCTQLASGFLVERHAASCLEFSLSDLVHAVHQQAQAQASAGRAVDPRLLRVASATKRARGYLAYVERRGLIQPCAPARWRIAFAELTINSGPYEVAYNDVPLLYAYNELQDLLSVS